jgi:hypothetical protein
MLEDVVRAVACMRHDIEGRRKTGFLLRSFAEETFQLFERPGKIMTIEPSELAGELPHLLFFDGRGHHPYSFCC